MSFHPAIIPDKTLTIDEGYAVLSLLARYCSSPKSITNTALDHWTESDASTILHSDVRGSATLLLKRIFDKPSRMCSARRYDWLDAFCRQALGQTNNPLRYTANRRPPERMLRREY